MESLMKVYKIPQFNNTTEFLYLVAKARAKIKKGGIPDVNQASNLVLENWSTGYIPTHVYPDVITIKQPLTSFSCSWTDRLNVNTLMRANHNYSIKTLQQEEMYKVDFIELKK